MHLNKSSMYHSHSKHIDVKYHTLRDIVEELQKVIQLKIIHIRMSQIFWQKWFLSKSLGWTSK